MQTQDTYNKILMFRFTDLHKAVHHKANRLFSKEGMPIPMEQLPVLMTLFYKGTLSQQEIADQLGRDKSSVLRSAQSLQNKKLIEIAQNPFDKRKKMVQLTSEGKKLGEIINSRVITINEVIFSCLSEEEKGTLETLIKKCIAAAKE